MGTQRGALSEEHVPFIEAQKMFFVGTATADSRINVSPKGIDSFRVLDPNRVIWLNMTGSGNETSAHIQQHPRMTIMFNAFEGPPLILRLYGTANVIHKNDPEWDELYGHFPNSNGARQIFDVAVDLVQSSCGYAVPLYDYKGERGVLEDWSERKGEEGIRMYWEAKNQASIDDIATNIVEKNL